MKSISLLLAFLALGAAASAEAKAPCTLPLYIHAAQGTADGLTDNTVNLFLYGLKSAVTLHHGCIVEKMGDAHLGLYINTVKLMSDTGSRNGAPGSSVVAVALAVPLNGIPVYMDDYLLVIRDSGSIDMQVNSLLQRIGETLDRESSPGQ